MALRPPWSRRFDGPHTLNQPALTSCGHVFGSGGICMFCLTKTPVWIRRSTAGPWGMDRSDADVTRASRNSQAEARARGVNETNRYCGAGLLPQSRRLPMGLPGAHARSRIHPLDRRRPLQRRLHDQLEVERVSGNSRTHLRPPVRAGLPARPRRGRAGRDLPPEARRRRLQGRHPRPAAEARAARTASASRWSAAARPRSRSRATSRRSATTAPCSIRTRKPAA